MGEQDYHCRTEVAPDHTLTVRLPEGLPVGPVDLHIRFVSPKPSRTDAPSMTDIVQEIFQQFPAGAEELEPGFAVNHDALIRHHVTGEDEQGFR